MLFFKEPTRINETEFIMRRKKSSKKVSVAENLNCDYSDSNVSDIEDENNFVIVDVFEPKYHNEPNAQHFIWNHTYHK